MDRTDIAFEVEDDIKEILSRGGANPWPEVARLLVEKDASQSTALFAAALICPALEDLAREYDQEVLRKEQLNRYRTLKASAQEMEPLNDIPF